MSLAAGVLQRCCSCKQCCATCAASATWPAFGGSDAAAAEVFAFYRCWESFVTYKHFAWAGPYNPAQAPNRYVCGCVCKQRGCFAAEVCRHVRCSRNRCCRAECSGASTWMRCSTPCYVSKASICQNSDCLRQVRRKMEDENRKARRVQRREYLDNMSVI